MRSLLIDIKEGAIIFVRACNLRKAMFANIAVLTVAEDINQVARVLISGHRL